LDLAPHSNGTTENELHVVYRVQDVEPCAAQMRDVLDGSAPHASS
jgi:hypothetical protein